MNKNEIFNTKKKKKTNRSTRDNDDLPIDMLNWDIYMQTTIYHAKNEKKRGRKEAYLRRNKEEEAKRRTRLVRQRRRWRG